MTNEVKVYSKETDYKELTQKAKELNIAYPGVKKAALAEMINEVLRAQENGEVTNPVGEVVTQTEETVDQTEETSTEAPKAEGTEKESPAKKAAEKTAGKRQGTGRVQAPKWFENKDAFPYNEGDVVEILDMPKHKGLIGRKAVVVKPSAKKDALKAHLLHPKTGLPQDSLITLEFNNIKISVNDIMKEQTEEAKVEETPTAQNEVTETPVAEVPTEEVQAEETEVTAEPVEEVKAENEEVSIPELDKEEANEQEVM